VDTSKTKAPAAPSKPKSETKPFVLKVKPEGAQKWTVLGFMNLRIDNSGGVATLFRDDGTKVEKVSVFPYEKRGDSPAA